MHFVYKIKVGRQEKPIPVYWGKASITSRRLQYLRRRQKIAGLIVNHY